MEAGADVLWLNLCGAEEMYWAVAKFEACAEIEVAAAHNPIDYNGMKIVKSSSRPLDDAMDVQPIRALADAGVWREDERAGDRRDLGFEAREKYVDRVLGLVELSALRPLKIVVNSGNAAASLMFDQIMSFSL